MRRFDLSDWVTHFIHDRDPDNDPNYIFGEGEEFHFPYHADKEVDKRFDILRITDELRIEPDAPAISVLLKILQDGFLEVGWAFRGGVPTIYGPRAACCFTEMPLYALIDYATQRADNESVRPYGIALLKRELFAVGGRSVIYGISRGHKELQADVVCPRYLLPECGIAEHEQYRYVATNLRRDPPMDWTHEREWRWCDVNDQYECPGLPIWVGTHPLFSTVLIIVPTQSEADRVMDRIKELYDSPVNQIEMPYIRQLLRSTRVVALEAIATAGINKETIRLDDLPTQQMQVFKISTPSQELIDRVMATLDRARFAAATAAESWRSGHRLDVFGFAWPVIGDGQSELVQALLHLKAIEPTGGDGYRFVDVMRDAGRTGLLGEEEAAAAAVLKVFEEDFPASNVWVKTHWD